MNHMELLRRATLEARNRTGDGAISTRADSGRVQIVRAVPQENGSFDVQPVTDWLPFEAAVDALHAM